MNDISTEAIHAGREDLFELGLHAAPIDQSSTYRAVTMETGGEAYDKYGLGGRLADLADTNLVYQRLNNPNFSRLERGLAALEGVDDAVCFPSGMAALTAAFLSCVAAGTPHIVAVRPVYGGTDHLLSTGILGTEVTWALPDQIKDSVTDRTGLVLVETPANPTLQLVSIRDIVDQAGDVPVMVDNTFATPILQRPAEHGAALIMHSATKYIGGHGDLVGGLIAGSIELTGRIRSIRAVTGAILHPQAAYMLHRGLQTLPVRVKAQQATAQRVAEWLTDQDEVGEVFYPGLEGQDPLGIVGTQMDGPGAMLSFTIKNGAKAATLVAENGSMIMNAVSLGGVDTLIQQPAGLTHRSVEPEARPHPDMLRLSVGLESCEAIVADLERMLKQAK